MSDDKALADRVVALGVGEHTFDDPGPGHVYWLPNDGPGLSEMAFVRDPRVAIALMERCAEVSLWTLESGWQVTAKLDKPTISATDHTSLPRAIIEACVLALEAK